MLIGRTLGSTLDARNAGTSSVLPYCVRCRKVMTLLAAVTVSATICMIGQIVVCASSCRDRDRNTPWVTKRQFRSALISTPPRNPYTGSTLAASVSGQRMTDHGRDACHDGYPDHGKDVCLFHV
jgi:hypothetical protein